MIVYALCGNSYAEAIAKLYFCDEFLFAHRSNAINYYDKIFRYSMFMLAMVCRYTICLLPNVMFTLAVPHSSNNYKRIIRITRPHKIYLIDDGITFEYWSSFHENNIKPVLSLPGFTGIIGPRPPNWPLEYKNISLSNINRADAVNYMIGKYRVHNNLSFQSAKNIRKVCVLDDGAFEIDDLKELADDFKNLCDADFCHILFHPSRTGIVRGAPAEVFILDPYNNIKAVYGKASTTLFNVIACSKNIKVYSQVMTQADLLASMKESGINVIFWDAKNGFQ